MTTEKIEVNEYSLKASNSRHIRRATVITIDGWPIRFTEKLTTRQINRYLESRKAQQRQAEFCTALFS